MPAHRLWMKSGASGRAINLNHTPYQHQHDAEGKDGHGNPQQHGFYQQSEQFADLHRFQLRFDVAQRRCKVYAGTPADDAGALLYYILTDLKNRHRNVKGVGHKVNCHEYLENPLVEREGFKVVKVVFFNNHAD